MDRKTAEREQFIDKILAGMTLDRKIGQLLTFMHLGTGLVRHDYTKIVDYACAGFRLHPHHTTNERPGSPYGFTGVAKTRFSPYAPPDLYARHLADMQRIAMDAHGIPLFFSVDCEGDISQNIARGGYKFFPSSMGLAAGGDESLVYEAAKAVARQMAATGITVIHSPCLDVNNNPLNPEIGTRSLGDTPEQVSRLGAAQVEGLLAGGIVATAKHFPGRGDSSVDAHHDLDANRHGKAHLRRVELFPYRAAIEAGLPMIMTAHNVYPALDPSGRPASVSRAITHDLLRKDMGFEGVITTDAIVMEGLLKYFNGNIGQAAAEAVAAGADLVLAKLKGRDEIACLRWLRHYVRQGKITEEELEAHNRRVLRMKYDAGLFKPNRKRENVERVLKDAGIARLCTEASRRAAILIRDRQHLLPLKPTQKILAINQYCGGWHDMGHDAWYHSHMLPSFLRKHIADPQHVYEYETDRHVTDNDCGTILKLARKVDVIVVLNVLYRDNPNFSALIRKLVARKHKVVVIASSPYAKACPREAGALLVSFGATPECQSVATDILFGKIKPGGTWPLKRYRIPKR